MTAQARCIALGLLILASPVAQVTGSELAREPTGHAGLSSVPGDSEPDGVVPGTLLVRRREGVATPVASAHFVRFLGDGRERWDLDGHPTAAETLAWRDRLRRDSGLRAEFDVDRTRWAQRVPNDTEYPKQWALPLIKAEQAWDVTTGDPTLVVAVVDTGVVAHDDLVPRLTAGYDFISDPDNAGDGDGRDPDPTDTGDEREESSGFHGTHIAGIIGAATNNARGVAGVDWSCRIQPVRVLGVRRHSGVDSDIADGIRWAAGLNVPGVPINPTPAKIVNLSFGGPGYSQVLQDAVFAAVGRGVLVVASAGNSQRPASENVPGALEGVLSVAAAAPNGALADYSDFGPRVDLMTPGGSYVVDAPRMDPGAPLDAGMGINPVTPGTVLSTSYVRAQNQPVYAYAAGTSQAAAFATGVAALVRAAAPGLRPEVVAAVMRRASSTNPGDCPTGCGAGLVDASRAVRYARVIDVAMCPPNGCPAVPLEHIPLRPEEGCTMTRTRSRRGRPPVAAAVLVLAGARRRRLQSRRGSSFRQSRSRAGWNAAT